MDHMGDAERSEAGARATHSLCSPGLRQPQLVVSISGGARDFVLTHELRNTLRKGLRRATEHTDAWVVTGGTNCGIMKVRK